ncbi:unnamed protein product [Protopolystoma xenopodis]|uniref:Uncharacterized protein n=1 Tax=Protopolystoma xenopodis TaxID=117903 RepID=A0A448WGC2_9PLAT|nr:unnamed protein product [Protopolystoma xenopodis]
MRSGTAQPRSTSRLSSPPPHQQQSTNAGISRHYTSHQHSHRHLRRHRPGFTAVAASGGFNTSSRSNDSQSGLPLSHLAASRISLTSPTANTSVGNDVISLPLSDISSSSHVDDLTSSSQLDNSEVRELMSEEVIVQTLTERRSPRVNLSQHRSLASDPRVTEEDLGSDGHSNAKGRSGCASNSVVSPTTNADTVLVSETESESESGELSGQHLEREGYVVRSTILESEAHNSPTRPHSDGEDDGDDTVEEKADIDDEDDRAIIEPAPDDIEDDMTDRGTDNEQDDHEARARVAERVRPYDDLYFSSHGDEYDDDEEAGNDDGDNDNDNDDDDEVEREQNDEDDNDERGVEAQIRELLRSPHHREDRDPILNVDSGSDVIDSDSSERRQYSALRGHNISRHCPRLTLVPLAFRGSASAIEGGGSSIATDYDTLESDILHVGSRPSIDVPSRHRKRRHQRSRSRSHDGCRGNRSKRRTQRRKPSEADCEDNLGNDMSDGRRRHKTSAASRSSFSARRRHRQHETKRHRRKRHHRIDDAPADETLTDASCLRCSRRRRRAGSDLDYRCDSPICRRHHRYSSLGRDADGNGVGDGGSMGRDVGGEAGGDRASLASSTAATVGTVGSIIDLDATSDTGGGWGGSVSSSILVAGRFCAPGPSNVGPRAVGLLGSGSAISPATTPSGGVDEEEEGEDEADEKDSQVDVPSHAIAVEEDQLEASDQVRHLCTDSSSLSLPVSTQFGLNLSLEVCLIFALLVMILT